MVHRRESVPDSEPLPFFSAGTSPARTNDDLPLPESPTTVHRQPVMLSQVSEQNSDKSLTPKEVVRVLFVKVF